jgi:hypothetical protein
MMMMSQQTRLTLSSATPSVRTGSDYAVAAAACRAELTAFGMLPQHSCAQLSAVITGHCRLDVGFRLHRLS